MSKTTKYLLNIFLFLAIVLLYTYLRDYFKTVFNVISYLLVPLIFAIYIYYALKPIKKLMNKFLKKNGLVSVFVFIIFILLALLLIYMIINIFVNQGYEIVKSINVDAIYENNKVWIDKLNNFMNFDELIQKITSYLKDIATKTPQYAAKAAGMISSVGTQLLIVLLGVFYLLKDDEEIANGLNSLAKGKYESEIREMYSRTNKVLETYISGQVFVSLILGILMAIGYLIIGLPNAILLGAISMITNLIPFIGPFIGAVPAIVIGLASGPSMVLKAALVTFIVQQLESNFITPNVMGSKLDIHPFVVVVVVLAIMQIFGVIGALIATPLYLIVVIIIKTIHKIYLKSKGICSIK